MQKTTKKAEPYFYEKVGQHIERWLKDNSKLGRKPGNNKELAQQLRKTPPQLSRYIRGINKIPADLITAICNLGFNNKYFDTYYAEKDGYSLEHLTKEDLYRLIRELQILSEKYQQSMFYYADRAGKYIEDYRSTVLLSSKLVKENDELRKELRELRKQLKNGD